MKGAQPQHGRFMDGVEAEDAGLVSRIVPLAELLDEAVKTAERIASLSRPVITMAKEAVTGPTRPRWPKASGSNAASSTPPLRWRIRRKA